MLKGIGRLLTDTLTYGRRWQGAGRTGGTYAFVAGPEDLPFAEPDVKGRAGELRGAVRSGTLNDDDIDCAGERRRVDLAVVMVRRADCTDGASQVVHGGVYVSLLV